MAISIDTANPSGAVLSFTLPSDEPPCAVSVVGSFNGWTAGEHELRDRGDGSRSVSVVVAAGDDVYFRYLDGNSNWFDDPQADEISAHGGVVHVPPAPTGSQPATAGSATADEPGKAAQARKSAQPKKPAQPRKAAEPKKAADAKAALDPTAPGKPSAKPRSPRKRTT